MADTIHEHKSKFTAENKQFKQKIKEVENRTNKLKNTLMKFGSAMAAAFSVQKIIRFASESIKAFDKQIQAEKKLEAAIRANGKATNIVLSDYKNFASQLQNVTTVGDETTLELLQLAESMRSKAPKEAAKGAIALSKALKIDLQSALKMVVLAQQGEYTMLGRYIPLLRSAGTETEKNAILQKTLADGFKLATEEAKVGLGPLEQLTNAFGDYKEEIGESIVNTDAFKGSMQWLKTAIENATDSMAAFNELMSSDYMQEQATWIERVTWKLARYTKEGRQNVEMMNDSVKGMEALSKYRDAEIGSIEKYQYLIEATRIKLKYLEDQESDEANMLRNMIEQAEKSIEIKKKENETVVNQMNTVAEYDEAIKKLQEDLKNVKIGHTEEAAAIKAKIETYQNAIDATMGLIDVTETLRKIMPGAEIEPVTGKADIDLGVEGVDTSKLMEGMKEDTRELIEEMNLAEQAALAMGDAMMNAAAQGETGLKGLANAAIEAAKKVIGAAIAEGIANAVSKALTTIPFPFNIAAGAAAGAAAATLFNSIIPSFAEGGAVTGPTLALVGEAAGISRSNPEFIGTARQISQMQGNKRGGTLSVKISKGDLIFWLNEGEDYLNNSF